MKAFYEAPKVVVTPAGSLTVKTDINFVPVHCYPVGWSVDQGEVGAVVKFDSDGTIKSVKRRVFT